MTTVMCEPFTETDDKDEEKGAPLIILLAVGPLPLRFIDDRVHLSSHLLYLSSHSFDYCCTLKIQRTIVCGSGKDTGLPILWSDTNT